MARTSAPVLFIICLLKRHRFIPSMNTAANAGLGRTLTVSEPKTKDFMLLLVQCAKGTA